MAMKLNDEILAVRRTVWEYDLSKATHEEIIEYFDENYGIQMEFKDGFANGDPASNFLIFRTHTGSGLHYMVEGDFLIINQETLEYEVMGNDYYAESQILLEEVAKNS